MTESSSPAFWWQVILEGSHFPHGLVDRLCAAGSTGVMEEAGRLTAYFDSARFPDESALVDMLQPFREFHPRIERLPASDWGAEWKKNFKPLRVSSRFVVRPSWEAYSAHRNDKIIVIDPKMAFGTGTHETTQLVLQIMDDDMPKNIRVLDVGTGSGILSIAAAKLGARSVVAVDVEPESMDNADENIRRNRVSRVVQCVFGTIENLSPAQRKPYDWILANIQRSVVVELLPQLKALLKRRGPLVVSGILTEEDAVLRKEFERVGFRVTASRTKGEWMAYKVEKL